MRVIAIEEHVQFAFIKSKIGPGPIAGQGVPSGGGGHEQELQDIGARRLASMDEAGIDMQVLSASAPGADLLDGDDGVELARAINNALSDAVRGNAKRFAAFAHLPMRSPGKAADELQRAVSELGFVGAMINGTTQDRFLDDPSFAPLLARAEELRVPLYLHPGMPPAAVRHAYYEGLPGETGMLLASAGFGWHAETAIHVLRLALSGTLDRYPGLGLIIGHMGEMLPMMLDRVSDMSRSDIGGDASIGDLIRSRVHITTSGIFTQPPLLAALLTFGIDRILFSVDYPYSANKKGQAFLQSLPLSPTDRMSIASGNACRLLGL
jgi:uncharacterized protein